MGYNRKAFLDLSIVNIDNEQILQNEVSLGRWIFDAIMLLFSIGESCDLQRQIEIKHEGFRFIPDMYWEKGCKALGIHGRTIIEIKDNLLIDTEINQTEVFEYLKDSGVVDNIYILYINSNRFKVGSTGLGGRVHYVKAGDFVDKIKAAIKRGEGDVIKQIKRGIKKKTRTWLDTRGDRMTNAINDFKRYDSVFFLGAGVSASAHIPSWTELLNKLLPSDSIVNQKDFKTIIRQMDYSNLIIARYIQKVTGLDEGELINKVRKIIYSQDISGESELIMTICNLISKQEYVRSVITYNYDRLIEEYLKKIGEKCISIYKNNRDERQSFPIYHVHGVIFRDNLEQQKEEIILSEKDYHEVYSKVFDWSNVEQLHALTRCTCFFIGLSMKDPNLRRLLEIAKKESGNSVRHYVFLERKNNCKGKEKREKDYQTREDILADLGLNVIWYRGRNNHKELPLLLQQFL